MAPKLAASLAAALAMIVGGAVLIGGALDLTARKSLLPGWISVQPSTPLACVLTRE